MKHPRDITGFVLGRLTVLRKVDADGTSVRKWVCRCECGNEIAVYRGHLLNGSTKSCGCLRVDVGKATRKHFGKGTPEYTSWQLAKDRCFNPNGIHYALYGGRGITMCAEWARDFPAFLEHVGPRPAKGYSLDRIDMNGDYTPGNVRWATQKEQCNNKRNNVLLTHNGKTQNVTQWAEELGIPVCNILTRIARGKSVGVALFPGKFDRHGNVL